MATIFTLMAAGTVALNICLLFCIAMLFNKKWRDALRISVEAHGRLIIFILVLGSVAGSLWIEYFANLPPCVLCWWQRIFMYPTLLISAIAIIKNTKFVDIADYILALSLLGAAVALYQHLLQILPQGSLIPCSATDECAIRLVFEFGYITLPWMALSVFALFILIAALGRGK